MISSRVFFLSSNTWLIVGISIYPKVEIKIILENKRNQRIEFTSETWNQLSEGDSTIGDIQIESIYIQGSEGVKICQNDAKIFILKNTFDNLKDLVWTVNNEYDCKKFSLKFVQDVVERICNVLSTSDTFSTAKEKVKEICFSPMEREMILNITDLLKIKNEKNVQEG